MRSAPFRLDTTGLGLFSCLDLGVRKVNFFTRLAPESVIDRFIDDPTGRMTILELRFTGALPLLLAAVHFHDRMRLTTDPGRALVMQEIAGSIASVERDAGHERTVLVGDLNMNPYEAGIVGARALHAVMTKGLARRMGHLEHRRGHPCFYNPMWSCLGDRSPGPAGSYFYASAIEPTNPFWHLFDQVLLRPEVMDKLDRLEILESDGETPFVTKDGRPRKGRLSDHLPLLFELAL